jgi:hypothetical protein
MLTGSNALARRRPRHEQHCGAIDEPIVGLPSLLLEMDTCRNAEDQSLLGSLLERVEREVTAWVGVPPGFAFA